MGKLIVSLSPHAHGTDTIERNMYGVIIALLPALLVSFYYFGLGSVVVCLSSVAACVFFEWAISKYLLKRQPSVADGSAIVTGLLLGMNMPSNLPVWIVIIGALVAIGVGKMSFGGLGCNPFNPALVGRCFLLVSFPAQMTSWPLPGQLTSYVDAQTGATPLAIMKSAIKSGDASLLDKLPSSFDLLLGRAADGFGVGSLGEVCALALLLGFAFLLWKKIITWHIPVSILLTVFIFSGLLHAANPAYANPLQVVLSGGLLLGAIFMATDYVTSPMTHRGQLLYGVMIGLLTVIIRDWGSGSGGQLIGVEYDVDPEDRNYLEPMGVNSIIRETNTGLIKVYANVTAFQDYKSDLNKLHVRENLNTLEIACDAALKEFNFKYNTPQVRAQVVSKLTPIFEAMKQSQALYAYKLTCDTSNNTEDIIDSDMLLVDAEVAMSRAMEKIVQRFTLRKRSDMSAE